MATSAAGISVQVPVASGVAGVGFGGPLTSAALCVPELLSECAFRWPSAGAIASPGHATAITFGQLNTETRALAELLINWGITRSHRIATLLPAGPDSVAAMLAIASCASYAPLNARAHGAEIRNSLSDLKADAVFISQETLVEARDAAIASGLPVIEISAAPDGPPAQIKLRFPSGRLSGVCNPNKTSVGLSEPDDVFSVLQTSGTTSRPKLVPLTQRQMLGSVFQNIGLLELGPADRCLHVLPPVHMMGITTVLYSLMAGCRLVIAPGLVQTEYFNWVSEFQPTWITAPPSIHQMILKAAAALSRRISPGELRFVRTGAAPMPLALLREIEAFWQAPLVEAYAMSECPLIASNHLGCAKRKPGSVGSACGVEVAFLADSGKIFAARDGVSGEILIRGPGVFSGYENNPAANADSWVDGLFRTGDLGRFDDEGFLHVVGRCKEMINRGGVKIAPREIEEVIRLSPAVSDAIAFAMPDSKLGEDVAVAAVLRDGQFIGEHDLRQFAAERLSAHKVPARILFLDELPTGRTGKPRRDGVAEALAGKLSARSDAANPPRNGIHIPPANTLEDALALIWQNTLCLENPVSVTDSFFDLGGDSLTAAATFAEVERVLSRQIPIATLLSAPTVRQLAAVISMGAWNPPQQCLVPIQPKGTKPPLFCLGGMYGHVLNFYPVARGLGNDQPVWGLQLPELSGHAFTRNIRQLASRFLSEIRQLQPIGPYQFLGYSFGGYVAYEMAQQLAANGEAVGLLGLMDTRGPGYPKPRSAIGRAVYHLKKILQTSNKMEYLKFRMSTPSKLEQSKIKAGRSEESHPAQNDVRRESLIELHAYPIKPYAGDVVLFRAADQPEWIQACCRDDSMGWGRFASNVKIQTIPGAHATILSPQNAAGLAEAVRTSLYEEMIVQGL